ncbi:hypothetical protein Y032_0007g3452 [Ancylostoma ceylanicum]|uniref:Uncharacterized protein n=1 Tax=Ancylostoma ceylanicum TaxID=53326 RepID=A0A016VP54_9BILA|nr:hypothetical protein Y032_0007g3452 [Ancylostoma ceylanicum]
MESTEESLWKFRFPPKKRVDQADSVPAFRHPLLPPSVLLQKEPLLKQSQEEPKYDFIDPLGATIEEDLGTNITRLDLDALEDISQKKDQILDNTLETKTKDGPVRDVELPNFEPWRSKRAQILSEHETSEKTGTYSTFGSSSPAKFSMSSKTRHRLEVLEDMSGLRKLSDISQNEFVTHVNELREQFLAAWEDNKRIEAVRIMTELARLLSAPTTPCFFPVQWVLVTDILDLFGKLVYERLLSKANEERQAIGYSPLTNNFVSDDILPDTTEVAQNWFCKIADIKEAVPRFYVETTLIGCLRFLDSGTMRVHLLRMATMVQC